MPPYFAFQRYRLPRVIPCNRHYSSSAIPASASFKMAMICSSLNRLLRTTPPALALGGPSYMKKSHFCWTNFWGAGQFAPWRRGS